MDGYAGGLGQLLDRAGVQLLAPARRPVRLGVNSYKLVLTIYQGLEMDGGELGCAGENDSQGVGWGDRWRLASGVLSLQFLQLFANALTFQG